MPSLIDLAGKSFGRWRVERYAGKQRWTCRCQCGRSKKVRADGLVSGKSKQCKSCATKKQNPRLAHGGTGTRLYRRWAAMKFRCTNPSYPQYALYGGRGIAVCERWANSFEAFKTDMGEPPPGKTLDRIDNNGNYEPGNCRWATPVEQRKNQRPTKSKSAAAGVQ